MTFAALSNHRTVWFFPIVVLGLGLLGGCASGARTANMVVEVTPETVLTEDSPLFAGVELESVSGGEETNPLWTSQVGDVEYEEALRLSLANHAMLADSSATYVLVAELVELEQPFVGFDMEVISTARYVMMEAETGDVVFDETFTTPFTADFSSSFRAVERLRLANEGAMRANIGAFIVDVVQRFPATAPGGPKISLRSLSTRQPSEAG